jgi:hypothetical protein
MNSASLPFGHKATPRGELFAQDLLKLSQHLGCSSTSILIEGGKEGKGGGEGGERGGRGERRGEGRREGERRGGRGKGGEGGGKGGEGGETREFKWYIVT